MAVAEIAVVPVGMAYQAACLFRRNQISGFMIIARQTWADRSPPYGAVDLVDLRLAPAYHQFGSGVSSGAFLPYGSAIIDPCPLRATSHCPG